MNGWGMRYFLYRMYKIEKTIPKPRNQPFVRLTLDDNTEYDVTLFLDVKQLREATPRILERYRIPADRSPDLMGK